MWILIRKKLPTRPSPPKMSLFWSVPWPDEAIARSLSMQIYSENEQLELDRQLPEELEADQTHGYFFDAFGKVPNWNLARKIRFAGADIRVFQDEEFTVVSRENLKIYLTDNAYEFVPEEVATTRFVTDKIVERDTESQQFQCYEAALLDGCTEEEATLVAFEIDFTSDDFDVPPLGWYRLRKEYAAYFCDDWEMKEDRKHYDEDMKPKKNKQRRR